MNDRDDIQDELPEIDPTTLEPVDPQTLAPALSDEVPELKPIEPSDEPVSLLSDEEMDGRPGDTSKIRGFNQGGISSVEGEVQFKRPLLNDGRGATRCKMFHCKLGPGPLAHMEAQINEWIDGCDAEVKFVSKVVGVLEGKRSEPNMFVSIWY